jgi:hypothetical protein
MGCFLSTRKAKVYIDRYDPNRVDTVVVNSITSPYDNPVETIQVIRVKPMEEVQKEYQRRKEDEFDSVIFKMLEKQMLGDTPQEVS